MLESYEFVYFDDIKVKVWKLDTEWYRAIPWRFSVTGPDGKEWKYIGIPNYCSTKQSALMRAWYRAKWINNGTIEERYL